MTSLILLHDDAASGCRAKNIWKRISAQNSDKTPERSLCSTLCSWYSSPDTRTHQVTHRCRPHLPSEGLVECTIF